MSNPSRQKGVAFESQVRDYLRSHGYPVERVPAGIKHDHDDTRTQGRGDFGRWDPRDDPDGDVTYPFALNNPPSRWNPKERVWQPT